MTSVFLCWTNRDPEFQAYLPGCRIMISPALANSTWSVQAWAALPDQVMVDSGTYSPSNASGISCAASCLAAQMRMLNGWPHDRQALLVHYDRPLRPDMPFEDYQASVARNLENAQAYIAQFPRQENLMPVGVLHALDGETLAASYQELKDMGYRRFALGSLVAIAGSSRTRLKGLFDACARIGLSGLHVLGISSPLRLQAEVGKTVGSFDTSSHIRNAVGGTVLYSAPFGRFTIRPTGQRRHGLGTFSFRKAIGEPRPCSCPICSSGAEALAGPDEREAKRCRKIHNAYHVIREVKSWDGLPI